MAVLFFIVFIDLVGFGIVIPLLPFYAEHFGASPDRVTLVMASYSLAQFFFAPIWGRLSDRFGRRPILLVSLAFSVASYLWLGFADALWMLYAARLLAGAGAGNIAAAQAYVADVTPPEGRAKGMGLIGAAFGLGFTVGPAIGGLLAGSDPTASAVARPAFVAAGLSAVAFIGTAIFLRESLAAAAHDAPKRPSRWRLARDAFGRPALRQLIVLLFVTLTAFAGMETTFAMWAEGAFGWGPRQVGGIFFFVGIVLILVQGGLIGRLTRRFGEARLLLAGSLAIAVGLIGLPFASTLPVVLLTTALLALGMGLTNPSTSSLISRRAQADQQGGTLGVAQSAASLARIIGPAIAGAVFAAWGRNAPYYLGAALMLVVVALALRVLRGEAAVPKLEGVPRPEGGS
jgi:DHA1 family tetracycline resistance protein-like MFS transporter